MKNIKDTFSIQDFEILTGIKAHTIRIWEKRYDLLDPGRLNRQVREYDLKDLQKILNVSLLYHQGLKISKIADLSDEELSAEAKKASSNGIANNYEVNSLIMAMYAFDESVFEQIYAEHIDELGFEEIFAKFYLPLLDHIGVLWQTDTIKPAHEHFISNLISQKIILNTALIESPKKNAAENIHVLFLPEGEVHELGLLFLNYYLKSKGKRTIYLGRSIPIDNLHYLRSQFENITWFCAFVIDKTRENKQLFIQQISDLLKGTKNHCHIIGRIWEGYEDSKIPKAMHFLSSFREINKISR